MCIFDSACVGEICGQPLCKTHHTILEHHATSLVGLDENSKAKGRLCEGARELGMRRAAFFCTPCRL